MRGLATVAAAVVLSMAWPVVQVAGDHAQDPQGDGTTLRFDHVKGNEWWVEVKVSGDQPFSGVQARDDGGPWLALEKKSWGVWAGSFHIEPGHRVQFKAVGAQTTTSCWFTHPDGTEQCTGSPPPPSVSTTFDHTEGNEWWVQVKVSGTPTRVQAQDTGGPWTQLQKQSWGDWAASFRIEAGHQVRFQAQVDGAWRISCWFTHPGGQTPSGAQTCSNGTGDPPPPPPSGDFEASFEPKPGNEWWVEVFVDANEPLAGVDARDDGGPWITLEKKSWGAWAKSFHVEDGSIVEFRARSTDGDTNVSGGYRWPEATPVDDGPPPPPPGTVDVAFGPKAGNEWWVEAIVVGDGQNVTAVEARPLGSTTWHTMTYRQWGAWAASFHMPPGSRLEMRATTPNGTDLSGGFTWPDAKPVESAGAWPEEGSYARVDSTTQHAPGIRTQLSIDHVFHDGQWWTHEEGWFDHGYGGGDPDTRSPQWDWSHDGPVMCDPDARPGETTCGLTVQHAATEDTHQEGDPVTVATWYGNHSDDPECGCNTDFGEWDQATGIQIGFHNSGTTWRDRLLLDTDAPMDVVG